MNLCNCFGIWEIWIRNYFTSTLHKKLYLFHIRRFPKQWLHSSTHLMLSNTTEVRKFGSHCTWLLRRTSGAYEMKMSFTSLLIPDHLMATSDLSSSTAPVWVAKLRPKSTRFKNTQFTITSNFNYVSFIFFFHQTISTTKVSMNDFYLLLNQSIIHQFLRYKWTKYLIPATIPIAISIKEDSFRLFFSFTRRDWRLPNFTYSCGLLFQVWKSLVLQ